jgi:hypothetical protein
MGPESNWEQKIVSELDSSLNEWVDSVPDHRMFKPSFPSSISHDITSSLGSES